jgi:hypothetical protein
VGEDAPVPRALPVPNCLCGVTAYVKQSRCARTAGRAFYCCWIREAPPLAAPCYFLQWIDGPDKFDPRIRLFPYASHVLKPYDEFQRWVPPPPNPPPMTYEEKQLAAIERVNNPPLCDCGVRAYGSAGCRCLNLLTSIGGTRSKVEGGDRHDLEPEGVRKDTRHKIYTGSGSQSSVPYILFGVVLCPALGVVQVPG